MVTIVKHEWHQCDVQYAIELDEALLSEIYPDLKKRELKKLLKQVVNGEVDVEDILDEAYNNDIDIEWEHQYDNMWTMNKGGYDVSYELGDESSWHIEPPPPEPTHKCTVCKWKGQNYDADWVWPEEGSDEEAKKVCPYCESEIILTEHGIKEEQELLKRIEEWGKEAEEESE